MKAITIESATNPQEKVVYTSEDVVNNPNVVFEDSYGDDIFICTDNGGVIQIYAHEEKKVLHLFSRKEFIEVAYITFIKSPLDKRITLQFQNVF